jgi:tetratricopeptide (TPR) repeat protein
MKRFYMLVTSHRRLFKILFSVVLCSVFSVLLYPWEDLIVLLIIGNLFLIWSACIYVQVCANYLIKLANDALAKECDPMPLLDECNRQLEREKKGINYQALLISKTSALANTGDLEEAYEILSEMNIDQYAGTLPVGKMVYYHNLAYICHLTGRWDVADVHHQKAMMLYDALRSKRQKKELSEVVLSSVWEMHYRRGEYAQAIAVLDRLQPQTLQQNVDRAWGYGCVYHAMGVRTEAILHLQYAAEHQTIYVGRRASALLKDLERE